MTAYIEIEAQRTWMTYDLGPSDLQAIGEFTRENISNWLDGDKDKRKFFEVGVYGWINFHAVCGDIDIPWALTEPKPIPPEVWEALRENENSDALGELLRRRTES